MDTDENGEEVRKRFAEFLENYHRRNNNNNDENDNDDDNMINEPATYLIQLSKMVDRDGQTLFLDIRDLDTYDPELREAITLEYYRYEPFLQKAILECVMKYYPDFLDNSSGRGGGSGSGEISKKKAFFISVYNLTEVTAIRKLKTLCLSKLSALRGTVTRTSDVRPEVSEH